MSKKQIAGVQLLYYLAVALIYVLYWLGVNFVLKYGMGNVGLGTLAGIIVYIITPVFFALMAVLMRFSLLRWHVDPFAAMIAPVLWFFWVAISKMNRSSLGFMDAAREAVDSEVWMILIVMFFWAAVFSLSFARKRGESISYRMLGIKPREKEK